jgi:hypothetical protein
MRDLLEADSLVLSVYTQPIADIEAETVTALQDTLVSLSPYSLPAQSATYGTYTSSPVYLLTVQKYSSNSSAVSQGAVMRQLVEVFSRIRVAMLRYPSDPTQIASARLWDELVFLPNPAPKPERVPSGFWYICQLVTLNSYQRVP